MKRPCKGNRGPVRVTNGSERGTEGPVTGTWLYTKHFLITTVPLTVLIIGVRADPLRDAQSIGLAGARGLESHCQNDGEGETTERIALRTPSGCDMPVLGRVSSRMAIVGRESQRKWEATSKGRKGGPRRNCGNFFGSAHETWCLEYEEPPANPQVSISIYIYICMST